MDIVFVMLYLHEFTEPKLLIFVIEFKLKALNYEMGR